MRKVIFGILALTLAVSSYAGVVFKMNDIVGDDNGPGNFTYPTDKVFEKGAFDLTSIEIADNGTYYDFTFTIPINFKNDWNNVNGWDVQMFDVYLKTEEGKHHQTVAGRNVKIKEGWDKVIVVSPAENKQMMLREIVPKNDNVADDISDPENLIADIIIPDESKTAKNILTARVKKERLPDLTKLKGIQVFLTGADGYPDKMNSYIRVVNKEAQAWRFGGGEDYYGDPNVIDILGDNSALKKYVSTEEKSEFAEISLIDLATLAKEKVKEPVVEKEAVVKETTTKEAISKSETQSTKKTNTKKSETKKSKSKK